LIECYVIHFPAWVIDGMDVFCCIVELRLNLFICQAKTEDFMYLM